jgi:peptidoglycan/xylan/chitin deacetylase (PgdA/CDA1 family)
MIPGRLRPVIRAAAFGAFSLARVDALLMRLTALRHRTLVLCLHGISPHANPYWPATHPRVFEELLRFLSRRARIRGLREPPRQDTRRPDVVLSFDDGYLDFVEYAMPLLERYGARANLNVIPRCVETGRPPWNVELLDALHAAPRSLLDEMPLPGFEMKVPEDEDGKARFAAMLGLQINHRSREQSAPLREALARWIARVDFRATPMMRKDDVLAAAKHHDIGAHAWQHESMAVESDGFLRNDVAKCRGFFTAELGLPMDIYAFPNGSYRPEQVELLRAEGIRFVLLVDERVAREPAASYPRISVAGATAAEVRLRAAGIRARA